MKENNNDCSKEDIKKHVFLMLAFCEVKTLKLIKLLNLVAKIIANA